MKKSQFPKVDQLLESDVSTSPMQLLQAAYADAPAAIKAHLDGAAMEVLMIELPKLQIVSRLGSVVPRDKLSTLEKIFGDAVASAEKHIPELAKRVSGSAREAGLRIAREIDKGFSVALLEDDVVNHMAYVDAMSAHAKLVKCIESIALTPQQHEVRDKFLRESTKKKAQSDEPDTASK